MNRNLAIVLLATMGVGLLGLALLDWARYTGFVLSLRVP
jgi:hypothetical protein